MCGRYSIISKNREPKGSVRAVRLLQQAEAENRFNAASSQLLPVITSDAPDELQFLSWGLLPHWAKDKGYKHKTINARAEMLTEKPMFRELVNRRRCLVPADGFYEWRTTAAGKVPYRFLLKDEALFCFAGLWDEWADKETGEELSYEFLQLPNGRTLSKPTPPFCFGVETV
ncbi:SOS response-associated peptidase [Pontibacter harenae]|uniref:SOS response-associated peptidase n=1 Tax=Pontibacter harenae TaxID=2894083 RepID=UPI001E4CAC96|nr:SOS response-associated peptidase [Pontibacter harenae]MCC9167980.1 SOS response-associated peptidase [Pontibacter harenae]